MPASSSKLTKTEKAQKIREARERAKAWSLRQKAAKTNDKPSIPTIPTKTTTMSGKRRSVTGRTSTTNRKTTTTEIPRTTSSTTTRRTRRSSRQPEPPSPESTVQRSNSSNHPKSESNPESNEVTKQQQQQQQPQPNPPSKKRVRDEDSDVTRPQKKRSKGEDNTKRFAREEEDRKEEMSKPPVKRETRRRSREEVVPTARLSRTKTRQRKQRSSSEEMTPSVPAATFDALVETTPPLVTEILTNDVTMSKNDEKAVSSDVTRETEQPNQSKKRPRDDSDATRPHKRRKGEETELLAREQDMKKETRPPLEARVGVTRARQEEVTLKPRQDVMQTRRQARTKTRQSQQSLQETTPPAAAIISDAPAETTPPLVTEMLTDNVTMNKNDEKAASTSADVTREGKGTKNDDLNPSEPISTPQPPTNASPSKIEQSHPNHISMKEVDQEIATTSLIPSANVPFTEEHTNNIPTKEVLQSNDDPSADVMQETTALEEESDDKWYMQDVLPSLQETTSQCTFQSTTTREQTVESLNGCDRETVKQTFRECQHEKNSMVINSIPDGKESTSKGAAGGGVFSTFKTFLGMA